MTENGMVGWQHWLNGHEFEQGPWVGDGQGSPVCWSPWSHKESDMTERLNWIEMLNHFALMTNHICIHRNRKRKQKQIKVRSLKSEIHRSVWGRRKWIWVVDWKKVKVKLLSHVRLFATPWTVTYQAPSSMEFSRQEYCSGMPFPSPGDLPWTWGLNQGSPALQADALPSEPPGKPKEVNI